MTRSHKIKLYPTAAQCRQLERTVGTARFAYNWGLDMCDKSYKRGEKNPPSGYELRKMWVANHPDWADEVAASCVYRSFLHVEAAYRAFFREGKKFPKFHKKGIHDTFHFAGDKGKLRNNKVRIPGVGYVCMAETLRYADARIIAYVVSKHTGDWYVSVRCEIPDVSRTNSTSVVGVDVGMRHWAVTSEGSVCAEPTSIKHYRDVLARCQRSLEKKQLGSNRWEKAKLKVSKVYRKITNIKLDTIHKFTSTIAKNHGTVVVEDLNIAAMMRSGRKSIRKGARNGAMAEIIRQLKYKCNNYVQVDRFYPSSKTCSNCGNVKQDLKLSDRTYQCHSCGFTIDRDLNAAINLRDKGIDILSTEGHSVNARG